MNRQNAYAEPMWLGSGMNFEDRGVGSRHVSREQTPVARPPVKQLSTIGGFVKYGIPTLVAGALTNAAMKYGPKLYNALSSFNKLPKTNPNMTNYLR